MLRERASPNGDADQLGGLVPGYPLSQIRLVRGTFVVKAGIGRAFGLLCIALVSGCAATGSRPDETRSARLPSIDLIEQRLERGVSEKADVERVLGRPSGRGGAYSGSYPGRPQDLWVYGEMGWSLIGFEEGTARVHVDQHLLMVFFEGEIYSGYWWHSTAGVATGTAR